LVRPRRGGQCDKALDELGRREDEGRGPVTPDTLEPHHGAAVLAALETVLRERGAEDVAAQPLEAGAVGRLEAHTGAGYFIDPTVFTGVDMGMTIAKEEIFGPVLAVIPFDDADKAVRIANATEFGPAAGVWTRDVGTAHAMALRLQAGTMWINTDNRFDAASPYGGVKQSGFDRENGAAVLDVVTQIKSVWVAIDR
jgi:acyl-CoA reductase-like NAD-dependent aldehyde dehydrogenase